MGQHIHAHEFSTRRDVICSLWILGFAATELFLGLLLANPALFADAGHGFMDVFGTVLSTMAKLAGRTRTTHRMQYHVPYWVGIGIGVVGVGLIGWVSIAEALSYIPVTTTAVLIASAMGATGCLLRFRLYRYMDAGKGPTDQTNAQHFRSDAETSAALLASGAIALTWHLLLPNTGPTVPEWSFRLGVLFILTKVVWDNWHTINKVRKQLAQCDCYSKPTS